MVIIVFMSDKPMQFRNKLFMIAVADNKFHANHVHFN